MSVKHAKLLKILQPTVENDQFLHDPHYDRFYKKSPQKYIKKSNNVIKKGKLVVMVSAPLKPSLDGTFPSFAIWSFDTPCIQYIMYLFQDTN